MDKTTRDELRHLAGVVSRPLAEVIRKAHDLQKHGDHDQSTHGNRGSSVAGESGKYEDVVGIANRHARYLAAGDAKGAERDKDLLLSLARQASHETGYRMHQEYHKDSPGEHYRFQHPVTGHEFSVWYGDRRGLETQDMAEAIKEMVSRHAERGREKVVKHGDHDQSTHGNRGGMSRAEGDPGRVDRTSGAGGFLTPPGHPEHTMHVQTDLNRRPENRGSASLSYAAQEATGLHPSVRDEAKQILQEWEKDKKPLSDPEVKDWTHQVLGYFRHMRIPESGSRNVSDLVVDPSVDSTESADRHAGVAYIRQYYPDYTPAKEDFEHAYWGRKPEKIMKHGDHDQSTHGHRGAESAATEPSGGRQRRENIQIGLRERADILRNRVQSDITDSRPVGRLSELGEALAITSGRDPAGPGRVAHGTPLGTLIWNAKDAPTSEQVAEWNQRWQESEQFERDALTFNYAVIEDNRTIGNRLVMEQGAQLKERGLLDRDEAGFMENFINGWHTRAVAHCQIVNSFLSGTVYVLVWYIALRVLVENLSTLWVALAYALGSGLGSLCLVLLSRYTHKRRLEKEARSTNETPDSDI